MRWHSCHDHQGVLALAKWVLLSLPFADPSSSLLVAETALSGTDAPPVLHLVLPVLEQLRRDQTALREAIDRLGQRQEIAFDQQKKGVRDQLTVARALVAQRESDLESWRAYSHDTVLAVCLVAAVFVLGIGCLAWSLFRTLQKFSARMTFRPQGPTVDVRGLPGPLSGPADSRVHAVIEQMERRLLKLENSTTPAAKTEEVKPGTVVAQTSRVALAAGAGSGAHGAPIVGTVEALSALPGDFV